MCENLWPADYKWPDVVQGPTGKDEQPIKFIPITPNSTDYEVRAITSQFQYEGLWLNKWPNDVELMKADDTIRYNTNYQLVAS